MQLLWEPDEYRYLCRIADYYHTKPAILVKQQMRLWMVAEYEALFPAKVRAGSTGGDGESQPHPAVPDQPGAHEC